MIHCYCIYYVCIYYVSLFKYISNNEIFTNLSAFQTINYIFIRVLSICVRCLNHKNYLTYDSFLREKRE